MDAEREIDILEVAVADKTALGTAFFTAFFTRGAVNSDFPAEFINDTLQGRPGQ